MRSLVHAGIRRVLPHYAKYAVDLGVERIDLVHRIGIRGHNHRQNIASAKFVFQEGGRSVADYAAFHHDRNAITQQVRLVHVVSREKDGPKTIFQQRRMGFAHTGRVSLVPVTREYRAERPDPCLKCTYHCPQSIE